MGEELLNQDDAWRIGQKVQIIAGPFIGFEGVILLINPKERLVRVMIDIFTRQSPVEVPISSIKELN
jgi:transcription termination/antitermination protein NusG